MSRSRGKGLEKSGPEKWAPLAVIACICCACERPSAQNPRGEAASTLAQLDHRADTEFGGDFTGYLEWVSANGRYVVLQRFSSDDDGDGEIRPRLGDHGESIGDRLSATLFDLDDGTELPLRELISTGEQRRWLVYAPATKKPTAIAFDTQSGIRLDLGARGADVLPGPNPCEPARQASLSPDERSLSWLTADSVVVRDLESGEEVGTKLAGKLWRTQALGQGSWVDVERVVADTNGDGAIEFPRRQSTCTCRACARLATSVGNYGWSGDAAEGLRIGGGRALPSLGRGAPAGVRTWIDASKLVLQTPDGEPIPRPKGCRRAGRSEQPPLFGLRGAPGAVLNCLGGDSFLYFDDGTSKRIDAPLDITLRGTDTRGRVAQIQTVADETGGRWFTRLTRGAEPRLVRVRVADARLEEVGPARWAGRPTPLGFVVSSTGDELAITHVGSGATRRTKLGGVERIETLEFRFGESGSRDRRRVGVAAPLVGGWYELSERPLASTDGGCSFFATRGGRLQKGPWRRSCFRAGGDESAK